MNEKLRNVFDGMVVYKDLKRTALFSTLSLPSFMRDWLLEHFEVDESGVDFEELNAFIREMAPSREDWNILKSQLVAEGEPVKIFAKISVDVNIKKGEIAFNLPDYGLSSAHTLIDPSVWQEIKNDLDGGRETWGLLRLGYRFPDLEARPKVDGKIKLLGFKNFCPYSIDLEFFKDARGEFETCEWIDLLLGAIDYNAKGYVDKEQKLTMLTRLLPFVEKRLNLIELAPQQTGKSYIFGKIGKYVNLGLKRPKLYSEKWFRPLVWAVMMGSFVVMLILVIPQGIFALGNAILIFMEIATALAIFNGILFTPRQWCTICPMGYTSGNLRNLRRKLIHNSAKQEVTA